MTRINVRSRIVDTEWFPFVQLGCVAAAWGLWYRHSSRGWVLAIALAPLAIRLLAARLPVRPTPLDAPLLLFLLTAGVGVWAAYDRDGFLAIFSAPIGWQKLWGVVLAALVFYALAALETRTQIRWALALLAGFGAAVAAWVIATNDWAAQPAEWDLITRLGRAVQAWLPALPGPRLNANVVGGVVGPLLPLSLGLVADGSSGEGKRQWPWVAWGLATGAMMAFGLLLTTSRGAWLGVGGGLALAAGWWLAGRLSRGGQRLAAFAVLVGLGVLAVGLIVALAPPLRARVLEDQAAVNRVDIFSQAALLVRDYPFTGIGLGNFALVHSTYALLIHVPIICHAHALLLDVAVEQGLPGALAATAMLGGAAWLGLRALAHTERPQPALAAGLLSLAILVVHGLTDDPLYSSHGVLLLWAPAGLVVAAWRNVWAGRRVGRRAGVQRWQWAAVGAAAVVGLALLGLCWRSLAAAWQANLGAVAQTQVELRAYDPHHFDNPTLDQIRQQEDLSAAEAYFNHALALDPDQVTARTRLAHIALGRGEYEAALEHTQAAWQAGHRDRVTRLLLGDALVAQGEVEEGVEIVRGLERAEMRLGGQAWYRYWVSEDYRRAADAWWAVVELNPENERARHSAAEAEARANDQ